MKMTTEMARGLGLLVLLCLAAAPLPVARSQMSLPFTGQGLEPAEPVDVYVSAMLERLLDVDDKNYRFTNMLRLPLLDGRQSPRFDDGVDASVQERNKGGVRSSLQL